MKFYLNSAKDWEPYDDLKNNKWMQKYVREIEKEAGVEVTFEKDITFKGNWHIVVDVPSMKSLVQIMKVIEADLVIGQPFIDKYPTICIYDDYIE